MGYRVIPNGKFWSEGVFCVPSSIAGKLKFAGEYQLKALLLLLSNGGSTEPEELCALLKKSESEVIEYLEFWVDEGIISKDGEEVISQPVQEETEPSRKVFEALPMPNLTPKDIVAVCAENAELADLLRGAEKAMGASISNSMKSNIINMVTYYGLSVPVVLTLLEHYKSERDAGKNITTRSLQNIAKEWAAEGVTTLEEASAKLEELLSCDELWSEIIALCKFDYRRPSAAQRKMVARWRSEFDKEMIFFACNVMKKYNDEDKQSLKIVDNILKEWKRKSFKTPEDVKSAPKEDKKKNGGRLKSKPSFDIDEIEKRSILNDDFDI